MRERLSRYLLATRSLLVVSGTIVTTVLVVRRDDCNRASLSSLCAGYTTGIHAAYAIIVIGAGLFVAAALAGTNLVQRDPGAHRSTTGDDDRAQSAR